MGKQARIKRLRKLNKMERWITWTEPQNIDKFNEVMSSFRRLGKIPTLDAVYEHLYGRVAGEKSDE